MPSAQNYLMYMIYKLGQAATPEMIQMLRDLRKRVAIGFVSGSDLRKLTEQLNVHGADGEYHLINVFQSS